MRKILLSVFSTLCFSFSNAQNVVVYEFNRANYDAPFEVNNNVTASNLTNGDGISTPTGNAGVLTYSGFNPSQDDLLRDYIQIVISPKSNYGVTIENIFLNNVRRSATGPQNIIARASLTGFANQEFVSQTNSAPVNQATNDIAANDINLVFTTALINVKSPVTIRIYGYNSGTGNAGNRQLFIGGADVDVVVEGFAQALPVRFANIKAAKQSSGIQVSFSNLTEEDVAVYHVERSANGINYQSIGTLTPKANNNDRADYVYVDKSPLSGGNYYRIRAVETAGKQVYSAVVKVSAEGSAAGLVLYPNPASQASGINLQLANLPAGVYSIRLFNEMGQLVGSKQLRHTGGSVSESLPLNGAQAGRYIVDVKGAVQFTKSFLLQ